MIYYIIYYNTLYHMFVHLLSREHVCKRGSQAPDPSVASTCTYACLLPFSAKSLHFPARVEQSSPRPCSQGVPSAS